LERLAALAPTLSALAWNFSTQEAELSEIREESRSPERSVLVPSSDARSPERSFLFLVVRPEPKEGLDASQDTTSHEPREMSSRSGCFDALKCNTCKKAALHSAPHNLLC